MMIIRTFLKTTKNKILYAVFVFGILFAVLSPLLLSSPECTTEANQQQRDATGCIIGADFGPGLGIIVGLGFAAIAYSLALILESAWFKKFSFLAKFFLLIPFIMALLYHLSALLGLVLFSLQKLF